jgi:hypothetical protein
MPVGAFAASFKEFLETMAARAQAEAAANRAVVGAIKAHLGENARELPVVAEEFASFEHPNVQVALQAYLGSPGRTSKLLGVTTPSRAYQQVSLLEVLAPTHWTIDQGPVEYVNVHLAAGRVLPCVQLGVYLIQDHEQRLVALVSGPAQHGRSQLRVEVIAPEPAVGQRFLSELLETMRQLNVYRGQVISIQPCPPGSASPMEITFHSLPSVPREGVVLPAGILERIERQTIVFTEHSAALLAAGRSLKRGLLLFGPPGIGKTLTVMYLIGRMSGRTVLLTTGRGMGLINSIAQLARTLAPAMIVIEDVDLIAQDRSDRDSKAGPLLFELLNEMDGLADDCDVIFMLTTNRADALEAALAARPGRIDLAVELPLPDTESRRQLFELYGKGLDISQLDIRRQAERTDGASPAYIKELLRKAAVLALASGDGARLSDEYVEQAIQELTEGGRLGQRILGFHGATSHRNTELTHVAALGFPTTNDGA